MFEVCSWMWVILWIWGTMIFCGPHKTLWIVGQHGDHSSHHGTEELMSCAWRWWVQGMASHDWRGPKKFKQRQYLPTSTLIAREKWLRCMGRRRIWTRVQQVCIIMIQFLLICLIDFTQIRLTRDSFHFFTNSFKNPLKWEHFDSFTACPMMISI